MSCSLARTLGVIGDRWTPLVLRDIALGISRFDAIQRNLGVSRRVLTERLTALVDDEVVDRVTYQEHPPRYDYRLTQKGSELIVALLGLQAWGDRWMSDETGPPVLWRHLLCGQVSEPRVVCSCCGEPLRVGEAVPYLGPGASAGPGTTEVPAAIARLQALVGSGGEAQPPQT
ncbi:winged helix-turn-helix transcriptional regulator [Paraconexibacter sp.]|uniref:winged helix-turn-helix transcriptional regulator n=1 Tax=Paraconexibacter sp. TaxID=2949640 RepID=UPI00356910BE